MHKVNAVHPQWYLLLRYTLLHKLQVGFPSSLSLKIQWITKSLEAVSIWIPVSASLFQKSCAPRALPSVLLAIVRRF